MAGSGSLKRILNGRIRRENPERTLFGADRSTSPTPVFSYTRARGRVSARLGTRATLLVLGVLVLLTSLGFSLSRPAQTAAATSNTINFQARLETSAGAIVPDGNYNVQFKLYDVSTGGTALWTESYLNSASQGIQVANGYLTANLGSITAFPSTINWDQQLYLTMNIGGTTTGSPTYDGEMSPRLKLTAVPYAFRAGQLADPANSGSTLGWATQSTANSILLPDEGGTLCIESSVNCGFATGTAGSYIQNQNASPQSGANFYIDGTGKAAYFNATTALQTAGTTRIDSSGNLTNIGNIAANGDVTIQGNTTLSGSQFTNNGSTLNSADSLGDFPSGGAIGTAAATVDKYTSFAIAQTTAGQVLSLPSPTTSTAGRMVFVFNTGSVSFTMQSVTIPNGYGQIFIWNGTSWILGASGGGSAITLQSAYDGGNTITTSNARDLSVTLANTATDANFVVNVASGSTGQFEVQNNGSNVLAVSSSAATIQGVITNINASSNYATNINTGTSTGAVSIGNSSAGAVTLSSGAASSFTTASGNLTLQAGSGTVSLGSSGTLTNTGALTVTGGSSLTLQSTGSGAVSLDSPGSGGSIGIGTSSVNKTITIGNNTASGATQTINIGYIASPGSLNTIDTNINIGTASNSNATTTIQAGYANGSIQIGSLNSGATQTVNVGTNTTAVQTVKVGSAYSSSTTTIQGGTGGIALNSSTISTNATTVALLNTTATTINLGGAVGSGGLNLAGGSSSTGCTLDGSTGNFTCSGNITTTNTSGTVGFWTRNNTTSTLQPTTSGDVVSSPGSGTASERFGASSSTGTYNYALAVGNNASVSGGASAALGYNASANADSVALGYGASAAGQRSEAIGYNASTSGNDAIAIGYNSSAAYTSIAIGRSTSASSAGSIALGYQASATASNQLVVGHSGYAIQDAYIGSGVTDTSPVSVTLHATGGSGTNIAGASINVAGGQGTGTGNGGDINFQIAKPGSSGSSLNSLSTVASFSGVDGSALFQNATDSTTALQIQNAAGSTTVFGADTTDLNINVTGNTNLTAHSPTSAPTVIGGSSTSTTNTLSQTIATNSSTQAGDLVIITAYVEPANESTGSATYGTITAPAGVTLLPGFPINTDDNSMTVGYTHRLYAWYYYATASGSQNLNFTETQNTYWGLASATVRGGPTSGDPLADPVSTDTISRDASASSTPPVSLNLGDTNSLALWLYGDWDGSTGTYPSGYTDVAHSSNAGYPSQPEIGQDTYASAGYTGSISSSRGSNDNGMTAALLSIRSPDSNGLMKLHNGSGTIVGTVNGIGNLSLQNSADSTAALQVQNAAGDSLFTADTANARVNIAGDTNIGNSGNRLFSDNFESGTFGLWNQGTSGPMTIDTTTVHDGKYAAKLDTSGSGGAAYADASVAPSTTVYARAWVNLDYQSSSLATLLSMGTTAHSFNIYRDNSTGDLWLWNDVAGSSTNSGVALSAGSGWHELELRITTDSTNGIAQIWLDGTLILNDYSLNTGSDPIDGVEIGDTGNDWFTAYFDDVSVDTSDPGTASSLSVGDSLHVGGTSSFGNSVIVQNANGDNLLNADSGNTRVNVTGDLNVGNFGNRLFSDNFESGNLNFWTDGSSGSIAASTTEAHDGKYSVQVNPSGSPAYDYAYLGSHSTIYARAWVYVSSQTSGTAEIFDLEGNGSSYWKVRRIGGQVNLYDGVDGSGTSAGSFTTGIWHEIELRVTTGSSTGVTQVWLDGSQIINLSSQNNGTNPITDMGIGDTNNDTFTSYIDDVSVDTSDPGAASSVNVGDSLHVGGTSSFGNSVLVQGANDTTSSFQIQNASGDSLLNVDSTNSNITLLGNDTGEIQSWQTSPNTLTSSMIAKSVIMNGYIYAISDGEGVTTIDYAKLNADGSVGSWTATTSVPNSNSINAPSVVAAGGYIYIMGGQDNSTSSALTTVYSAKQKADGTLGSWTTLSSTPLPAARYDAGATVSNGYIYVVGGYNSGAQNNVYYAKYNADGTLGSWTTQSGVLPTSVAGNNVVAMDGHIYSIGGYNGSPQAYDYYASLNPSTGATSGWTSTGALPAARDNARVVAQNGYIYAITGDTDPSFWDGANTQDSVYYAKPSSSGTISSWSTSSFPVPASLTTPGVANANGYIYVVGGYDGGSFQPTAYYTSGTRLQIGGSLDLVGIQGGDMSNPGAGGSLTAGNTNILGALTVQGQALFHDSVTIAGNLTDNGSVLFQNTTNSTTAFQVQNASNQNLFQIDTSGNNIILGGNNSATLQAWNTNSNALSPARQNAVTLTANGYVYVIGGSTAGSTGSTCGTALTTASYAKINIDGSIGTWGTTTSLPAARCGAQGVVVGGYIYIIGGWNSSTQSTVYYAKINTDGTLGSWTTSSNPLPSVRDGATVVTSNGYIYVVSGEGSWNSSGSNTIYYAKANPDGSTSSWTTATPPRNSLWATAVAANGYLYTIGGYSANTEIDYAPLNPNSGSIGTWGTTTSLPSGAGTNGATSVIANGYMYVLGGNTPSYSSSATSAVYYAQINSDGTLGSWSANANAIPTAQEFAGSVTYNGYIYELGGQSGWSSPTVRSTVYYSSTQRIKIGGSLDLVGAAGGNGLGVGSLGSGSVGGQLTAGDTNVVGSLQVAGQTNLAQDVSIGNNLNVGGNLSVSGSITAGNGANLSCSSGQSLQGMTINGGIVTGGSCVGASYARVYKTTSTSVSAGGTAAPAFNAERADTDNYHSGSNNYFTIPSDGFYNVGATISYGTTSGTVQICFQLNGSTIIGCNSDWAGNGWLSAATSYYFSAGDQIGMYVYSTTSAITVQANGNYSPEFYISKAQAGGGSAWAASGTSLYYNGGNVGIGTSSPSTNLDVEQNYGSTITIGDNGSTSGSQSTLKLQGARNASGNTFANVDFYNYDSLGSSNNYIGASIRGIKDGTDSAELQFLTSSSETLSTAMTIRYNGDVCIGTTSCTHTLGVNGSGVASGGFSTGTPDVAEYIDTSSGVTAQDIVIADPNNAEAVTTTSTPYDPAVVGVIADGTSGFQMLNAHYGQQFNAVSDTTDSNAKPMTVTGRVPVKVTGEGGAIKPGDYLTTSSTAGYAMKADHVGPTIGKALGFFNGTSSSDHGSVLVLVDPGYGGPTTTDYIQSGSDASLGNLTLSGTLQTTGLQDTGTATIGNVVATDANIQNLISSSSKTGSLLVNGSANINTLTVSGKSTTGDLEVKGSTTLATLHVTGDTTFDGNITIGKHVITAGQAPAVQVETAAGSGATCTLSGNDTGGSITIDTGNTGLADGTQCTVTFHTAYGQAPNPVISPRNKDSAQAGAFVGASSTKMTIQFAQTPAADTTYKFNYFNTQ